MWECPEVLQEICNGLFTDFIKDAIKWLIFGGIIGAVAWLWKRYRNQNPRSSYVLGRKKETKRLIQKIKTGQSGAIIGIFGKERTQLLHSLQNKKLYDKKADNLIFFQMNISSLDENCTPEQFWKIVLEDLRFKIFNTNSRSNDYKAELKELEKQGLIQKLNNSQWQVLSPVFIQLLKEKDTSTLCSEKTK